MKRLLKFPRLAAPILIALFAVFVISVGVVFATAGASLNQCANGVFGSPLQCINAQWQNGDLNVNNSHYREGDVVPFQQLLTGLTSGTTYSVTIQWQNLNSDPSGVKHSYDYITSFNATETNADPCNGGTLCSGAPSTFPIPPDPSLSAPTACGTFAGTQLAGVFSLFGGTITGVGGYSQTGTCLGNVSNFQSIVVTFVAGPTGNMVLAWGGHIASDVDWGTGNGATQISGSPYHMFQEACSFTCGAQDRQMKAAAVIALSISTQRSPAGTVAPGQNFSDSVTLVGNVASVPTGTVTFYMCRSGIATISTTNPICGSPADANFGAPLYPATVPVVTSGTSNGFATSPVTNTQLAGAYCFLAVYNPSGGSVYPMTDEPINVNATSAQRTAECFTISGPTAVTVNSFDATTQSLVTGMTEWAALGLGIAGALTLGLVAFVVMRRK